METNVANQIKMHFTSTRKGIRPLKSIEDGKTYTIKEDFSYGVGVVNENEIIINEKFSNVFLESKTYLYNGEFIELIVLSSTLFSHNLEFSYLCAQFIMHGENKENRNLVVSDPFKWWEKWRELLGNSIRIQTPSSLIAELYVYYLEIINGNKITWLGPESASHDLQGDFYNIEVKSTLAKYKNEITVSGEFQLKKETALYIAFVKLEESISGYSINSLLEKLEDCGEDIQELNRKVVKLGFEIGSRVRDNKKYRINEIRYYEVNEKFPQISNESFKLNKIPDRISKIVYDVNLEGINYEIWYD